MNYRMAFSARVFLAALLVVWLASPARAQHGGGHAGGGGGGSHGGGGGGHAGSGGGHAASGGGGHVSGGSSAHVSVGRGAMAPAPPSGGHAVGGVGSSLFASPSAPGRSGAWVGSSSWQAPPGSSAAVSSAHPGVPLMNSPASGSAHPGMVTPMRTPGRAGMPPGSLMTRPPLPRRPPTPVMGGPSRPSSTPGRFPFRGGCRFDPDCDGDIDFFPHGFFGGFGFGGCPFWSWNCGFGLGWNWGWGWGWGWGWSWDGFGYPGYGGGYYPPPPPPDTSASQDYGPFSYQYPPAGEGTVEAAPVVTTVLVLKDGSSYSVTDYWLEQGRLHYVTSYGGENQIPIDQLDLQRTVDENAQRGVTFSLRPAPATQPPQDAAPPPEESTPAAPPDAAPPSQDSIPLSF